MSDNSSTTIGNDKLDTGLTEVELWIHLIVFYFGCAAIGGTILNAGLALVIVSSKKFRSRFYVFTCFWLLNRFLIGFQSIQFTTYRILRTLHLVSEEMPLIGCQTLHLFIYYASSAEVAFLLVLVIDRILAIAKPMYYRSLSVRQAVWTSVGIQFLVALANWLPSYFGMNLMHVVQCINVMNGVSAGYSKYFELEAEILTGALFVLQIAAMILIWYKLRQGKQASQESELALQLKRQVALMSALRNLVFGHILLLIVSRTLLVLEGQLPQQALRLTAYAGVFMGLDVCNGTIILFCSNKDLREETRRRCCRLFKNRRSSMVHVAVKSNSQPNDSSAVRQTQDVQH